MKINEVIGKDDVGQKIYKGGTTRVVHTPVADKNISTLDQRVDKFASDRDTYNAGTNDATMSTKGTNELIAKAKSNIKQAYNKQDAVDARQGAGQSYITKGKPVKFDPKNSASNIKLAMDDVDMSERKMTKSEKAKEDSLKDKYDDSDMKKNMKKQYGDDWKEVYYATIRKKAMNKGSK